MLARHNHRPKNSVITQREHAAFRFAMVCALVIALNVLQLVPQELSFFLAFTWQFICLGWKPFVCVPLKRHMQHPKRSSVWLHKVMRKVARTQARNTHTLASTQTNTLTAMAARNENKTKRNDANGIWRKERLQDRLKDLLTNTKGISK